MGRDYAHCSWGLLLPDIVPNALGNGYADILFLLNLYSPRFLRPVFYLSNSGIYRPDHGEHQLLYFHDQNQVLRFRRTEFVEFYKTLASECGYGSLELVPLLVTNTIVPMQFSQDLPIPSESIMPTGALSQRLSRH